MKSGIYSMNAFNSDNIWQEGGGNETMQLRKPDPKYDGHLMVFLEMYSCVFGLKNIIIALQKACFRQYCQWF